jgi:tRNA pseudouridine55 synthase
MHPAMRIGKNSGGTYAPGKGSGFILMHKKPGVTSFQALNVIKKIYSTGKVGHTGTLDKFASGLLLVLVNRAVKLTPWFSRCDKEYEGTIQFGIETDTLDIEGSPIAEAPLPDRETLEAVLPQFRGDLLQAPPVYSAIHLNGKRAYTLARSGTAVDMEKRPVSIHALELLSYDPPLARIRVRCSKGTYIRSLARDIALAAGSRGHLIALTRTGIAAFRLADAADIPADDPVCTGSPAFDGTGSPLLRTEVLRPITPGVFAALGIPRMEAEGSAVSGLLRGKPLDPLVKNGALRFFPGEGSNGEGNSPGYVGVFDGAGNLIAVIGKKERGRWVYGHVYADL